MTTPQTPIDALMALVSEYAIVVMADYARGFAPGIKQKQARDAVQASARALAATPEPKRCPYCDDTGDVHSIDGEWRGRCTCPAGKQAGGVPAQTFAQWHDSLTVEQRYVFDSEGRGYKKDAGTMMRMAWDAALAAAPSPSAVQPLSEAHGDVRVACITLDGSTLYIPAKWITDFGIGDDDGETYTLTFKTMKRADFEALGEFDGF